MRRRMTSKRLSRLKRADCLTMISVSLCSRPYWCAHVFRPPPSSISSTPRVFQILRCCALFKSTPKILRGLCLCRRTILLRLTSCCYPVFVSVCESLLVPRDVNGFVPPQLVGDVFNDSAPSVAIVPVIEFRPIYSSSW